MKYRRNLDGILSQAINDAVVALDDLADRLVAKLRHHPSRARVLRESPHRGDDPLDDKVGVMSGVASHIRPYRLDVLDGLGAQMTGSPEKSTLCLGVVNALPSIQLG